MSADIIEARNAAYKHNRTSSGARKYRRDERATAVASTRSARLLYNRASSEDDRYCSVYFDVGGRCGSIEKLLSFSASWESIRDIFKMSDAAATPAKAPKRKSAAKAKKPASHPKYSKMIKDAVTALKVRWKLSLFNLNQLQVACLR